MIFMSHEQDKNLKLVYWQDIREKVKSVNPEFAQIIDQINPDKNYPLIQASYNFGDLIVKDGETFLPSEKGLISLNSPTLAKTVSKELAYTSIPLFLTLQNANEVYIHSGERAIPLNTFHEGSFLGLFETIDFMCGRTSSSRWCVSAGSRNVFMLPKLNDISGFKKLKIEFNLDSDVQPRHLTDHWRLFKNIAQHPNFKTPWKNTVLFFTRNWFQQAQKDLAWFGFERYIFKEGWTQADMSIGKIGTRLNWQYFSEAIAARNLKPTPYLSNQLKHLLLVSTGQWPGFRVDDTLDAIGPMARLQEIILDVYALKKYYPTVFYSSSLATPSSLLLYYSLSYPSILEGSYMNDNSTIMLDMRTLKLLIETIQPILNKISQSNLSKKKFTYLHVENDKFHEIQPSSQVTQLDPSLLTYQTKYPNQEFCETSQFWRGCFMIQEK
jgi:hypothetical protein